MTRLAAVTVERATTIAVIAAALAFCRACTASVPPAAPRLLALNELTPAEIKYGRAPKLDPSVTYESDVILVGGAESIRSVSDDGLTWTLDARAPHAEELAIGKIAFVTGHCVGRVLWTKSEGDAVKLVLGPVELTDIFRKLDVTVNQPIDLSHTVRDPVPHFQDVTFPMQGEAAALPTWAAMPKLGAATRRGASWREAPDFHVKWTAMDSVDGQPVSPGIPQRLDLTFHTQPLNDSDGTGAQLSHDQGGVRAIAQVQLRARSPRLEFDIHIANKKVDAKVILHNAIGLKLAFDAAVNDQFAGNVEWYSPVDGFSIPVSGPGALSVSLRQEIWVTTAFSARQSMFSAGGDYEFNADVGFTYRNGKFDLVGPKGLVVRKNLMGNMSGVSIGPSGLVISHALTITAGVGPWGFTTGPSFALGTAAAIAQGSSVGIVRCEGVALRMNLRAGVGWTIPKPVATVVNLFLRIVGVSPIKSFGGIYTEWLKLIETTAQTESKVCGGAGGGT